MYSIKQCYLGTATFLLLLASTLACCIGCKNVTRNSSHPNISNSDIKKGESLAKNYCQSCHVLPDPSQLDSKTWENGVLPAMGPRLGIFSWNGKSYPSSRHDMDLIKDFYPQKPILQNEEWQSIIDYFIATSPDTLENLKAGQPTIKSGLTLFDVASPAVSSFSPATSATNFACSFSMAA